MLYVFGFDFLRVIENVDKFVNFGVFLDIIGKFVIFYFVILSFFLREESLDIIKFLLYYYNNIIIFFESFKE